MAAVTDVWRELSETLRRLRLNAGMSLRQVEAATGRGRGLLSQVETGKARPSRELVEWYDHTFHADGHAAALFAEARGAHGVDGPGRTPAEYAVPGDSYEVLASSPASGLRIAPGSAVTARWVVRNTGSVPWRDRSLRRVGSVAGARLLTSPASVRLPDTDAGSRIEVEVPLTVPSIAGTFAGYWEFVDHHGRRCFARGALLAVTVVADW